MNNSINRVAVTAVLLEAEPLQYTPAGIPVLKAQFHHHGESFEAGQNRLVEFDFPALAFADVAARLSRVALGTQLELEGFLANRSIRSKRLTVHITDFKI